MKRWYLYEDGKITVGFDTLDKALGALMEIPFHREKNILVRDRGTGILYTVSDYGTPLRVV